MLDVLDGVDAVRCEVMPCVTATRKAELGQFMTPAPIARFMASLFAPSTMQVCRLLDPGAGMGALTAAFLERWARGGFGFERVSAHAYEVDPILRERLARTLASYAERLPVYPEIIAQDFIAAGAMRCWRVEEGFTHAILNPPYKKIRSDSIYRQVLSAVGIETVNLYSAFLALAVELLAPGGQVVAIIPRSFCNGPYYRPFREFVLQRAAIRRMHLFASRTKAFKDDGVRQENVIILLERGARQGRVTVSTSTDDSLADSTEHVLPFRHIVDPRDTERFIHVPISRDRSKVERSEAIRFSLADIGVRVSTGPVVDFRVREHLRAKPERNTVPLLYPVHFGTTGMEWPKLGTKKPNALKRNAETERWLYPNGSYCVVRRFSSKEERRRIVASVVDPDAFGAAPVLGFENHLNVFHNGKRGLPKALAAGLAAFLNTTAVDESFRRFNGHTQVNATDLRQMKYPSRGTLIALGKWARRQQVLNQTSLDECFSALLA